MTLLDNDHRLYADNWRTQIDIRVAKVPFDSATNGWTVGVDGETSSTTNYATGYAGMHQYSASNTSMGGSWNNPMGSTRRDTRV